MIIVAISVLFTNNLARSLQEEEQKNMSVWAEATRQLIFADNDADIDFVSSIIEKNTTIPVYICDAVRMTDTVRMLWEQTNHDLCIRPEPVPPEYYHGTERRTS